MKLSDDALMAEIEKRAAVLERLEAHMALLNKVSFHSGLSVATANAQLKVSYDAAMAEFGAFCKDLE